MLGIGTLLVMVEVLQPTARRRIGVGRERHGKRTIGSLECATETCWLMKSSPADLLETLLRIPRVLVQGLAWMDLTSLAMSTVSKSLSYMIIIQGLQHGKGLDLRSAKGISVPPLEIWADPVISQP